MIKIKVWSDFDCPYCYISKHQIAKELAEMGITDYELEMLPYQLSPEKFNEPERTFFDALELTSESDQLSAQASFEKIFALGQTVGLEVRLATAPSVNTALAHRLVLWAKENNPSLVSSLIERLFQAHLSDNEDISSHQNLIAYAREVGFEDEASIKAGLEDETYQDKLDDYLDLSYDDDIELIPHYYLPNQVQFAGIPPVSEMKRRLNLAFTPKSDH